MEVQTLKTLCINTIITENEYSGREITEEVQDEYVLSEILDALTKEISELRYTVWNKKEKLRQLKRGQCKLENKVDELEDCVERKKKRIRQLKRENDDLQEELDDLREEVDGHSTIRIAS